MIGAKLLDRDRADDRPGYRDPLGLVSEGRPPGRARRALVAAAVCGAGLLAGLGLFGGSPAKPAKPVAATGIMTAADALGTGSEAAHAPRAHRLRTRHPAKQPAHWTHSSTARHKNSTHKNSTRKGSAGTGAPHGAVRHSPARSPASVSRPAAPPATVPHAGPVATPRTARPATSPGTAPAVSR
ncbi:hypothetical protein GCM10009838_45780 [Catenulispora subtropica]|uniref:Uncharacterized protein n=1 Tax=Catenulispora subtropica TaxID=450798 RepID=A0ABP5DFY5_9ACTN